MKILFFIRSLAVGGSQRQLVMLADGLVRRGYDVAIAVFYTGGEMDVARQQMAARVLPLGKTGRWDTIGPLSRLRRFLLTEQPDVVYAFQPTQTALAALLLPRRLPTRLVFGVRAAGMEPDHYDSLSALTYRLEVWLSRRADLVIANARAGRADAISGWLLAERAPLATPDARFDRLLYPIHQVEEYLKARAPRGLLRAHVSRLPKTGS